MIVVRFADDTSVAFEHAHEAKAFLQDLHERMCAFELQHQPHFALSVMTLMESRRYKLIRGLHLRYR